MPLTFVSLQTATDNTVIQNLPDVAFCDRTHLISACFPPNERIAQRLLWRRFSQATVKVTMQQVFSLTSSTSYSFESYALCCRSSAGKPACLNILRDTKRLWISVCLVGEMKVMLYSRLHLAAIFFSQPRVINSVWLYKNSIVLRNSCSYCTSLSLDAGNLQFTQLELMKSVQALFWRPSRCCWNL